MRRRFPAAAAGLALATTAILAGTAAAKAANLTQPGAECQLQVPDNPLTAQGLATPYVLSGPGCNEANPNETAFLQAAILAPSGAVSVYEPLVIDKGTQPAAAPIVPSFPAGSIVAIWTGFDALSLNLNGKGSNAWINGIGNKDFGQYAYTESAPAFFAQATKDIAAGTLVMPPLGVTNQGAVCPTVESAQIVDQDPSDNLQTEYLALPDGQTMQANAANAAAFPQASVLANPSDNRLLTDYVDPVLGCQPWEAPDLANPGSVTPALALDQLQATLDQAQPVEDVELSDEMTLVGNGNDVGTGPDGSGNTESAYKTALYRAGVDEPASGDELQESDYCTALYNVFPAFLTGNSTGLNAAPSPDPAAATNLGTFLAQRFVATWLMSLPLPGVVPSCSQSTGLADPVTVTTNSAGVATGYTVTPTT